MKLKNLKLLIKILICSAIIFNSCKNENTESTNSTIQKSPKELKQELRMLEKKSPTKYLTAGGTFKESFWGNKLKINCTITNKATLVTYKDAVVRVTYFTKTKTTIDIKDITIYEIFSPKSTKTIELKIENYKDVDSIAWKIVKAVAVN